MPGPNLFLDICSGPSAPLSTALDRMGHATLAIDLLISPEMDLLNDTYFENLLRLCASGLVAYCGASPPCSEFSLLKLRTPGPTPVRTHEFPLGIPNPTPTEQDRIQRSRELLHRAVCCLQHTFAAGGHGHLESPPNAFTWYDPVVKSWVNQQACHCVVLAACQFSLNISKHWMFACSHDWFVEHASQCPHSNHAPYAGIRDESGTYLSRKTAEYPKDLATVLSHKLSAHIGPVHIPELTLEHALSLIPVTRCMMVVDEVANQTGVFLRMFRMFSNPFVTAGSL